MTTLHTLDYPRMEFPVLDEKMDMASSPFRQVEVEDLDLEFDQMENPSTLLPSDNPMEDASEISSKADEAIYDDDAELLEDANMQDDAHVEKDLNMSEEVLDNQDHEDEILYDEEDDTTITDSGPKQISNHSEVDNPDEDLFDFDDTDHIDISTVDQPHNPDAPIVSAGEQEQPEHQPQEEDYVASGDNLLDEHSSPNADQDIPPKIAQQPQDLAQESSQPSAAENDDIHLFEEQFDEQHPHEAHGDVVQEHSEAVQSTENPDIPAHDAETVAEAVTTIEISNLAPHFATVIFNGVEYPLFSEEEPTSDHPFPLPDSSLLFEPLDKLLESCRQRLFNHVEEHLDEVTLSIPAFDLHYCQDSKYAPQHSLADILQVYVMLKQNEKAQSIHPLSCLLTIRTCAATQYKWLVEEARKQARYDDIASPESNHEDVEEPSKRTDLVEGEPNPSVQNDAVEAEAEAEVAGDASGEAFEEADAWTENADNQTQSKAFDQTPTNGATDSTVTDKEAHADTVGNNDSDQSGSQSQQASQDLHFFDDTIEGEDAADEAEDAEEAQEQEENQEALEDSQASLVSREGLEAEDQVEDDEQLDFGEDPEPFKQVEDEKELFLEDEDLYINPNDPLETDEDPDALLEGRTAKSTPNGHHPVKAVEPDAQSVTPSKGRTAKRKVEDEDDFLELDFDTPEPKRRRASPT